MAAQLKLRESVRTNNVFNARFSLREGADVNHHQPTESPCIILAVIAGHAEMVSALAASKADLEAHEGGRSALHFAAEKNDVAVADVLLSSRAEVDAIDQANCGETPLVKAARMGHYEVAALLVSRRANVEARIHSQR